MQQILFRFTSSFSYISRLSLRRILPFRRVYSSMSSIPAAAVSASASINVATPVPVSTRVGLIDSAAAASLNDQDWHIIRWLRRLKDDLPERPKQTGFRVFSILTYKPSPPIDAKTLEEARTTYGAPLCSKHPFDQHMYIDGTDLAYVTGTNTEPCFIGNSICSERSAILQMRMKRYESIEKLYLTADSDNIITPGLLCREMLSEFLHFDTPIIMACYQHTAQPHPFNIQVTKLRELYPYPSIYLNVPGSTVAEFGKHFHSNAEKPSMSLVDKPEWLTLYRQVVAATTRDGRPGLHPLRYAAGVLLSDGTMHTQGMTKLLEYGWSLDPVIKLIPLLEEKKSNGIHPVLILAADHFGNLHSLHAPARSHLSEYGYTPTLLFHNRDGHLVQTSVRSLAPDVPDAIEDTLPHTVVQSTASAHDCAGAHTPHPH
jgi:cytidine deaminase